MSAKPLPEPDFAYDIAANEYGFYCVPESYKAREVPKVLAAGDVYEPATLKLMQRLCGPGDIIAGGAFVGDFLPALHAALVPGAQLHSFEPNPVSRAACALTIALNGLTRVTVHPCAVGAEAGTLPLQVAKPDGEVMGARAKIAERHVVGETVEVPVRTLDSLIDPARPVSVLQLDIEGHEGPALEGAARILRESRPVILLEAPKAWQQRAYAAKLADQFPGLGYRFCGALERNAVYRSLPA
jgi:FkbM family methyltransferase